MPVPRREVTRHRTRRPLKSIGAALLGALALVSSGCGSRISRDELGEVMFEVPQLADQPEYTLPELAPKAPRTIEDPAARPATTPQS